MMFNKIEFLKHHLSTFFEKKAACRKKRLLHHKASLIQKKQVHFGEERISKM